jgi:hypothetical protein
MDLKKLANKAKKTIDERGGMDSLKADAEELKKVAKGEGSLGDKAKRAAKALKEPGSGKATKEPSAKDPGGEMHPAKHVGNPEDTPRKGGPPHA